MSLLQQNDLWLARLRGTINLEEVESGGKRVSEVRILKEFGASSAKSITTRALGWQVSIGG